jgi:hypothetical protein
MAGPRLLAVLLLAATVAASTGAWEKRRNVPGTLTAPGLCDFGAGFDRGERRTVRPEMRGRRTQTARARARTALRRFVLWNGNAEDTGAHSSVLALLGNETDGEGASAVEWRAVGTQPFLGRPGALEAFDEDRRRIVTWGGQAILSNGSLSVFPWLLTLDLASGEWNSRTVVFAHAPLVAVPSRSWTPIVWWDAEGDRDLLFVHGGTDASGQDSGENVLLRVSTATAERLATGGPAPPAQSGHASTSVNGSVFILFGYTCLVNFVQSRGGKACYHNDLYVLDKSTLLWTRHRPVDSSQWPSRRSYTV